MSQDVRLGGLAPEPITLWGVKFCIYICIHTYYIHIHIMCLYMYVHVCTWERTPQNPEYIYKNLCTYMFTYILTWLNFSHLQSSLHLMQYTYGNVLSTAQNGFWTCWFWWLLELLLFFVSLIPHGQNVSLWGLFSLGETKKKSLRETLGE